MTHFLNNHGVKRKCQVNSEDTENEKTAYQSWWDIAKTVVTGKFVALNAYIGKEENVTNSNLNSYLGNWRQRKPTEAERI